MLKRTEISIYQLLTQTKINFFLEAQFKVVVNQLKTIKIKTF